MAKANVKEPSVTSELEANADAACDLLRSLAHPIRLMILCMLVDGPRTVSELSHLLGDARQSLVSQHLARLRYENIVHSERDGNHIRYSLNDETAAKDIIWVLHSKFCSACAADPQ